MRNLHLIIRQEYRLGARRLFRDWERLRLRSSDYKNHRIFSLRCIHQELIPVSIKLKTTINTPKARQIIRKAEKELLQARVKAINNILVQVDREIEECRAKLAAIISAERLEQCQGFINKVSELRFNKVKQRQINKLDHLVAKKEGNIATANANYINQINRLVQSPPRSRNPTPATALLPPGEGSTPLPGTVHLSQEGNSSHNSQSNFNNNPTNSQATINNNSVNNLVNNQGSSPNHTPATALLPPGEGSTPLPATVDLPREGNSQANNNNNLANNQTNNQGSSPNHTPAIAHLPPGEGSNSLPGAVHLPSEDYSSPHPNVPTPAGEENNSSQAIPPLPTNNPQPFRSLQAGHSNNPPRACRQGTRHPPRQLPSQSSQETCATSREDNHTSTPPIGPIRVLPGKNPTLSGSLTFPTNL